MAWQPMETAPKDREILARRHNDVADEYFIVWWHGDEPYPWHNDWTEFTTCRLDEWHEIPK